MDHISMMIFSRGKDAEYNGTVYKIDYVSIRNCRIYVYLCGLNCGIPAEHVYVEPTKLALARKNDVN